MRRVCVTGAGGAIGQSIIRSLQTDPIDTGAAYTTTPRYHIIAVDARHDAAGLYEADEAYVVPSASNPHYLDAMQLLCEANRVDVLIPGTDPEVLKYKDPLGDTHVAVSPRSITAMCASKFETVVWAHQNSIQAPATARLVANSSNWAHRHAQGAFSRKAVFKPNYGSGSEGIVVTPDSDVTTLLRTARELPHSAYVVQEYIDGEEYTALAIVEDEGVVFDYVCMIREPKLGANHKFVKRSVISSAVTSEFVLDVAVKLSKDGARGPVNIQFRVDPKRGPMLFEINARFPGSTILATHAGMNGPQIVVDMLCGDRPQYLPQPKRALTFMRRLQEVVVPTDQMIDA